MRDKNEHWLKVGEKINTIFLYLAMLTIFAACIYDVFFYIAK